MLTTGNLELSGSGRGVELRRQLPGYAVEKLFPFSFFFPLLITFLPLCLLLPVLSARPHAGPESML